MNIPFFYIASYQPHQQEIVLDENTSRHVVQVLRMKSGQRLNITDGIGNLLSCTIKDDHKKHCRVTVDKSSYQATATAKITVAISLVKNASRFEWFLEKATEIGVTEIIPLICERTEKEKFRTDRLQQIVVSAMLQSQQVWLPVLHEPIAYELLFRQEEVIANQQKFIAHCIEDDKKQLTSQLDAAATSKIILIGPEGDFTSAEIDIALANKCMPVALGNTRLRTETAGVVAASLLIHTI